MPELPEIEIIKRGLQPHLDGSRIDGLIVRNAALRWPIPEELPHLLQGLTIRSLKRRGKYLIIDCGTGQLIVHLGMSGSLRILAAAVPAQPHDHFDLLLENGKLVRFTDPRRFGSLHWRNARAGQHPLLKHLGQEPLERGFNAKWLYRATRGKKTAIKQFLMNSRMVAGIGNIYANEVLFRAGIHPTTPATRLGPERAKRLVSAVKQTLRLALRAGGSTLRNFVHSDGAPGEFQLQYRVYGREGRPCRQCGTPVRQIRQGQRASFYCVKCQS